jgi:hypothetical protein
VQHIAEAANKVLAADPNASGDTVTGSDDIPT